VADEAEYFIRVAEMPGQGFSQIPLCRLHIVDERGRRIRRSEVTPIIGYNLVVAAE